METPTPTTTHDFRRTITCAALATITSLATFSLVANVMTPIFAGSVLLAARSSPQQVRAGYRADNDASCVPTSHTPGTPGFTKLTMI